MRKSRNSSIIKISIIISLMIFQSQCRTKETVKNEIKGNIIFLIGTAEVIRNGISITNLNFGEIVREGDIIKTGDKSQVIVQIGDRGIIRIIQNTEIKIISLFMNNDAEIFLQKGEIISKISRLLKDENYCIATAMFKAAVRGTTFSVKTFNGEEQVSVLKGKVLVSINENISKTMSRETYLSEGEIAVVSTTDSGTNLNEVKIEVMPADKTSMIELKKIEAIDLFPDIENIKIDEFKIRQQEMLRKEQNIDRDTEKIENGTTSKINAKTIEQLIKQKTRTIDEIKKVNGRIDQISLNSGKVIKGAIISRGNVYSVLTTDGVINVQQKDISTIKVVK